MIEWMSWLVEHIWYGVVFAEMCFIYEFIYGFSLEKVRKLSYFVGVIILAGNLLAPDTETGEAISIGILVVGFQVVLFTAANKHRLRNSMWIWPIIFTGAVPSVLVESLLEILDLQGANWSNIKLISEEALLMVCLGSVYYLNRRGKFSTTIKGKDRYIVSITSLFVTYLGMNLSQIENYNIAVQYKKMVEILGWIGIVLLTLIVLWSVVKGSEAEYYKEISQLNEKHIEEVYSHFKAYKAAEYETRKLRHDMKNHVLCLKLLYDEGKQKEFEEYLESLMNEVNHISSCNFSTGNDMVDTILSAKQQQMREQDIQVEVVGSLAGLEYISPIDWSTIFANALDNAVQALTVLDCKKERKIILSAKSNRNFIKIQLKNPCVERRQIKGSRIISSKPDRYKHGFGLGNIQLAVEKYQGSMQLEYTDEGNQCYFELNILLPLKNQGE